MFISGEILYLHLQKTGGTHVKSILAKYFPDGIISEPIHRAATKDQITSRKLILCSIRNPWDWYLSQWTYGAEGKGGLHKSLTRSWRYRKFRYAIKNPAKNFSHFYHELKKDTSTWREAYDRSDEIKSFRRWLRLIHDPANSPHLYEGYGDTRTHSICGFMTYLYLNICCLNADSLFSRTQAIEYSDLIKFNDDNCYVNYFIRQESLETDLCRIVESLRPLTPEDMDNILSGGKTNTSARTHKLSEYYDQESIDIVSRREQLIIEKFNYVAPKLQI